MIPGRDIVSNHISLCTNLIAVIGFPSQCMVTHVVITTSSQTVYKPELSGIVYSTLYFCAVHNIDVNTSKFASDHDLIWLWWCLLTPAVCPEWHTVANVL